MAKKLERVMKLMKVIVIKIKVVYMCSSWLQLAFGSRDLSQAEKRITVVES